MHVAENEPPPLAHSYWEQDVAELAVVVDTLEADRRIYLIDSDLHVHAELVYAWFLLLVV